ncbi:SusC/RagA family TonB-linked outer membrane protein [Bacteroides faecis]|jgi:tonB-linked outer membrane protein, susC/ragA family|uniref:SusC/RagA family TonB-linked outer membrane protein n=5 Tax=Bacteroides faecis TaxID=674529 RepID=UPI001020437F|nr:SusC/RagA family TonB-linked outer membrane protein [Bacteroides faecis]KAA5265310.1 SusC/RagA family TonB-linked outer membrane protein [Bacteroides faecis]KAA5269235.1 SusC/RagA family TonB-linked outer membrane protein [Bacteroides faecis]KAA5288158.1 SusC/RagA family TonB-linked outer membrane protein [Bacteroides faecis]KAA5303846.1 SusC/RagA family TonB-linked outer membrane protein [Bacteroides faecis]MCS2650806.1 SusC/RagA family TonB-linked outer membrane protein [Bacteroides faeci
MKRKLMLLLACLLASIGLVIAQTPKKVTGVVISEEDDQPVVGASVLVKGTTMGTVTDIDGKFTIDKVPSSSRTLKVSYIGMKTQEVPIKTGTIKIVLTPDSEVLEEVVVTGMQKMDKRLFTGAATKLDAEGVKLNGMADISRGLEGRAAGVSVQNVSGTFGTAPKIRVRGATSIYGSSKPLWVVDGVIMEDVVEVSADELSSGNAETLISSAIAGLNADDIESFQILKDGSATSIYGARAMAGVIVVTTKKGKAGQSHISYTGEFTSRLKPSYRTYNIMNSQDQMAVYQELAQKGYLNYAEIANASSSGVYGKMYQLITEYDKTSGQFGLTNTDEAKAAYLRGAEYRNTNWFDRLFSSAIMHNHSVSLSAGTDKAQHYVSASAMFDPGWYKQSEVQRFTANLNSTFKISKKLEFNLISNASYRKQKAPGTLGSETDAVSGEVKRDFDINPYSYSMNTSRTLSPNEYYTRNYAPFNIFNELENNYMKLGVTDFRLTGRLTYKPISKLELSILAGMQSTTTSQEHYITDNSNQAQAYRAMPTSTIREKNPLLYTDPDNIYALPISILPNGGIYERTDRNMFKWDMRASISYNDVFNDDHIVNFYGGMETNSVDRHSTWFRGWGLQYTMGEVPNYAYQVFKKGQEDNSEYYNLTNKQERSAAFFGNATYSYQGKYTINGTVRYEGTNSLGKSRSARWLPTWNVAASWNMHEEEWFKNLEPAMSHLTLKTSYSLTAERPSVTNAYAIIDSKIPWRPFTSVNESMLYVKEVANQDLTYEKKHEFNIGLASGFLDNRINFELDWYSRRNYDLIGLATTQGLGGQIQKYGNIATMKSSGVEISLTTTNIKTRDFTWTTNFIYSHTQNEVTELETSKRIIDLVSGSGFAQEGYPVRSLFSIPFKGLNEEGLPTFLDQDGNISTTGIYFQTSEPEKMKFLEYSGNIDPTDVGSFGNIFRYKNLSLNVFITYSFGNVVRLDPVFKKEYNDLTATPKEFNNRWVVPGDENKTTIPVIASKRQNKNDTNLSYAYNAYNYSTERIAKGDFIRMKEISLGYDFPKSFIQRLKLSTLSLKLQATNLFLIYADKKLNGQDPEFFNTGGVAAPTPKQFTLTLRLGI